MKAPLWLALLVIFGFLGVLLYIIYKVIRIIVEGRVRENFLSLLKMLFVGFIFMLIALFLFGEPITVFRIILMALQTLAKGGA